MRDTLFISHATPEDSPFTEWLYAQLTLAGYKCWCDLEGLYGGERDFSEEIQNVIENEAAKFLLVFSSSTFNKEFVKDEYEFARSLARKNRLKDFIMPLRIGDVSFDTRIGLNRYNHFHFFPSWPEGLSKLLRKLHNDGVNRSQGKSTEIISSWAKNNYTLKSGISQIPRKYFSNWWKIEPIPSKIYVFQYLNESQAAAINEEDTVYPTIRHGNCVIAFEKNIVSSCLKQQNVEIFPVQTFTISVQDILSGFEKDDFPTYADANSFLKRLLKKGLKDTMFNSGLSRHKMSGNQECFYYRKDQEKANRVPVSYDGYSTKKNLLGKYLGSFWHFGISFKVLLKPFPCFSLKSHLVFSYNGLRKWEDDSIIFKARRQKGRMMFNKEWRDLLLAMINSLKNEDGEILLVLNNDLICKLPFQTITFNADFDYTEPTRESRISLLSEDFIEDDEEETAQIEINDEEENDGE